MNGTWPKDSRCGGCREKAIDGDMVSHHAACIYARSPWSRRCQCGHWGGFHSRSPWNGKPNNAGGCLIVGCICTCSSDDVEAQASRKITQEMPAVQPPKRERLCECGSWACGATDFSPGHSRWCPAYSEKTEKDKEAELIQKVKSQTKVPTTAPTYPYINWFNTP